jgi:hypothetical protein
MTFVVGKEALERLFLDRQGDVGRGAAPEEVALDVAEDELDR